MSALRELIERINTPFYYGSERRTKELARIYAALAELEAAAEVGRAVEAMPLHTRLVHDIYDEDDLWWYVSTVGDAMEGIPLVAATAREALGLPAPEVKP